MDQHQETIKQFTDGASVLITIGTLMETLPLWAALFTIIWTGLRIYEWFENRWRKKRDSGE